MWINLRQTMYRFEFCLPDIPKEQTQYKQGFALFFSNRVAICVVKMPVVNQVEGYYVYNIEPSSIICERPGFLPGVF